MPFLTGQMASRRLRIPKVDFGFRCVVTNTTPIGAYRGAGRPEATALVERAIDMLAAELGIDPAELRRRNFIPPDDFPHTTVTGATYDSGEYDKALDARARGRRLRRAARRAGARRERGDVKQLGIGLCSYVEVTAASASEVGTSQVDDDGTRHRERRHLGARPGPRDGVRAARVADARHPDGRHHASSSPTRDTSPRGMGTMGSRSLQIGGSARARRDRRGARAGPSELAAHLLEADADDIVVVPATAASAWPARPRAAISWAELAGAADDPRALPEGMERGLRTSSTSRRRTRRSRSARTSRSSRSTPRPARSTLLRHVAVDDCGRILNPLLVAGQQHGGIAQGVAQALYEEIALRRGRQPRHRRRSPTTRCRSAAELPALRDRRTPRRRRPRNPLGAKGIGESGTIGSDAGRAERRRRRARRTSASTTSTCRRRRAGVGGDRGGAQRRRGAGRLGLLRPRSAAGAGGLGIEGG